MKFHALKMATNYRGTPSQLAGCLFDDADTDSLFGKYFDSKVPLLSNDCERVNMLDAIEQVVAKCEPGDRYGIFYSGHGTYTKDQDGDEADGRDEAIVSNDLKLVYDDEIFMRLSKAKPGVLGFLWTDCCHADGLVRGFEPDERPRYMPFDFLTEGMIPSEVKNICDRGVKCRREFASMRGDALENLVHFAACQSTEVSYDARFGGGRANGAFTYYATRAYSTLPLGATYADWMARITPGLLPSRQYDQTPVARGAKSQVVFGKGQPAPPVMPPVSTAGPGVEVIVGGFRAKTWEKVG